MAKFEVNDTITQFRYDEPIRKGIVVKGPFNVDKVDHYHVKWEWQDDEYGTPKEFRQEIDLICDLSSTKYHYK
jgi:hypothetical protein